jgi:hypothetical protein
VYEAPWTTPRSEVKPTQPVAPGLREEDEAEEHGEVRPHLRVHLLAEPDGLRTDPSLQEMPDPDDHRDADERCEQPALQVLQPREGEHVERGIPIEHLLRVPEHDPA